MVFAVAVAAVAADGVAVAAVCCCTCGRDGARGEGVDQIWQSRQIYNLLLARWKQIGKRKKKSVKSK